MSYQVTWTRRADRRFSRLPQDIRQRVLEAAKALGKDPRPRGVQPLRGEMEGLFRIRVGRSYRVVYEVDDDRRVVTIVNVGSREGIYG